VRDPELLLDMLRRRESLGSTGIGKGVAIPHGRSLAISELRVLFARSEPGVEFDAVDSKPVHLFFLIVAPPQDKRNEYLPLLGRIAELVKDRKVRDRLRKVEDFEDLRELLEEQIRGE
jgi:mannitol/fructose-specific phosphotransferase system IIA component (Ntr-type)